MAGNSKLLHGQQQVDPEWEIPPAALSLGTVLGEGEFGIVHKGRWNGTPVAIKVLKAANQRHRTKIALEVDVLRRLRHPNVVQFLGACTRSNPVTIVSEVLEGGSLGDALQTRPRPPLRRALEIALDCARGLNCLHCASPHPILHRDLKPDNIMLTRSHGIGQGDALVEGGAAKLADFGLSRIVGGGNGGAVRAPASNPFRNSGSGSLDMTPPSDLASPPSSNASWVGQVHAFDEEDLDVAAVDEMLVPRARDSAAPASLQAYASSPGGELATPGPTASAISSDVGEECFRMTGGTGSYSYMAPEIFRHLPYNAKADVYSLAMVMYEMLSGRRPFLKLDPKEAAFLAARDGLRPKWKSPPKDYSSADRAALPEVQAFVERCWSPSPASRPTCSEAIVEIERLISLLGRPRMHAASSHGPVSEPRRRTSSLTIPKPARVVDSVQGLTSRTLSRFAWGSPERSMHCTPRRDSECAARPRYPSAVVRPTTAPIDVPHSAPTPSAMLSKPRSPLSGATGADLPAATGPPSRVGAPPIGGSLPFHKYAVPQHVPSTPSSVDVLSSSVPGTGGMSERRKSFLKFLKKRVATRKSAGGTPAGEVNADSAAF